MAREHNGPEASDKSPSLDEPGLTADEIQLRAQGHKGELPRQFGAFATISLAFSLTNSWIGYSAVFATPLYAGGGPTVFFGLIIATFACLFITAGLAELASAFPSSGGQYHFAFMVAPPKYKAAVAFTVGWFSVLSWALTAAGACIFCAQVVVNLGSFLHPDYIWTQWQCYLVYDALCIIAVAVVIFAPRAIPTGEKVFFYATISGFVVFFITVLACSKTKQSASTVFTEWNNQTGWGDGTAFLLGVGTAMYTFLATDGATHIAEELPNPGRNVPRAMMFTIAIGASTAIPWTIAFMFSTNDLTAVATSYLPILTVYNQALNSTGGAAFLAVWLLIVYFGATISCFVTAGRLTWAFARDNGLPFSAFFARTHPTLKVPVNATLAAGIFCILYGLIYIASTTAFNSFISLSILGLNVTMTIPQTIVLFRGRKVLPTRQFNLGPIFGPFCNLFATLWVSLYTVLFCFPVFLPVTLSNMNYLSVVVAGICVFTLGMWWGGKRKTFVGPNVQIEGVGVEVISAANTGNLKAGDVSVDVREPGVGVKSGGAGSAVV